MVVVRDSGKGYRLFLVFVIINVFDVNDYSFVFKQFFYIFYILENMVVGIVVGQIIVIDKDIGENVYLRYQFEQLEFYLKIDSDIGVITIIVLFDREEKNFYNFIVVVSDYGDLKKFDYINVKIFVGDLNDNSLKFFNS